MNLLILLLQAFLYGIIAALIVYGLALIIGYAVAISDQTKRSVAVVVGVIVTLLVLLDGLR